VGVSTFNVTTPPDEEFITATSVVLMEMLKEEPGFRLRIPAKSVPVSGRTGVYFAVDYRTESLTVRGDVYIVGSERLMKAFLLIVAVPAVSAPEYQETVTYFAHHFEILDSESGQSLLSGYPEVVSVSALAAVVVGACAIVIAYARRRNMRVRLPPPPKE
jgi:predicted exporter